MKAAGLWEVRSEVGNVDQRVREASLGAVREVMRQRGQCCC